MSAWVSQQQPCGARPNPSILCVFLHETANEPPYFPCGRGVQFLAQFDKSVTLIFVQTQNQLTVFLGRPLTVLLSHAPCPRPTLDSKSDALYIHSIEVVINEHLTIKKDYGNEPSYSSGVSVAGSAKLAEASSFLATCCAVSLLWPAKRRFKTPLEKLRQSFLA